jgi:hypothetical protein
MNTETNLSCAPCPDADIVRTYWPVETGKSLNLYLGTGRCGGCFDAYGLQHQDETDPAATRVSHTWLAHGGVWHRGRHGLDTQVPLARLRWLSAPGEPESYRQHLEIGIGQLTTEWVGPRFRYTLTTFTSPAEADRDLLFFHLKWQGTQRPSLTFAPVPVYHSDYSGPLAAACVPSLGKHQVHLPIQRGNSRGTAFLAYTGDLATAPHADGAVLHLAADSGAATFVIALGHADQSTVLAEAAHQALAAGLPALRARAAAAWQVRWGSPVIDLPDPQLNALARRSLYHLLCTYAPDVRCPPPPMGFSGNAWGFHFPQDLSCVHPALLHFGHSDITRAHVEFYHSRIADQQAITRELYGKPGVCWSWEFPIGPDARLFRPEDGGAPNAFQFELHNAAYPARMAIDTAAALRDTDWTRDIAWPIVRESARFLASLASAEADGTYSLFATPSMGQDEFGGPNAKNYLCALFATDYTLREAVALAAQVGATETDEIAHWRQILAAGLAYARLLQPEHGIYAANETLPFVPRKQKHPVQLNPLWILPFAPIDSPTLSAYRQRRLICSSERDHQRHSGVPTGYYEGWTLFAFQLAATRLGDARGLAHELSEMLPARLTDPACTTLYESSGFWKPYYTTSMGLFLQATCGRIAQSPRETETHATT